MGNESQMDQQSQTAQIAIDGAAGAGKSTVGEVVARELGYLYIDSGAFYRALTAMALRQGTPVGDEVALLALLTASPIEITRPDTATASDGRQYTVLAAGEDITPEVHSLRVSEHVSTVARHPEVRKRLIAEMRAMAAAHDVVMVGRDIGLVVLPNATLKIDLRAPAEERARRRHAELVAGMGEAAPDLDRVLADIEARDAKDAGQMALASDAIPVENRDGQFDTTVTKIVALLQERLATQTHAPNPTPAAEVAHTAHVEAGAAERDALIPADASATASTHGVREGAYVAPKVRAGREVAHDGTVTPWVYNTTRAIAKAVTMPLLKLRVEGLEHVPSQGAALIASNHASWFDIPLLSFRIPRVTHYMAKIELFTYFFIGWLVRNLGAFPVRRNEGDRESLKNALRILKSGELVNIYPEGHRSKDGKLQRGLAGVALIALMADVPVIPTAIANSHAVLHREGYGLRRPTVTLHYGEPFKLAKSGAKHTKEDVERGIEEIMTRIALLLPPEQRGYYAEVAAAREAAQTAGQTTPAEPTPTR
jgi:cytidylate kinase